MSEAILKKFILEVRVYGEEVFTKVYPIGKKTTIKGRKPIKKVEAKVKESDAIYL